MKDDNIRVSVLRSFAEWLEDNNSFDYHGDMQDFVDQFCQEKWINTNE